MSRDNSRRPSHEGAGRDARPLPATATEQPTPDNWRARAACAGQDTEAFYPRGSTGIGLHVIEEAKAVCRRCPVQRACLTFALDTDEEFGVWGGLTENERRALRRRKNR